jgi:chemotaxis methyl-accepting protein methylase
MLNGGLITASNIARLTALSTIGHFITFKHDGRYHVTSEIKRLIRFKHLDLISGENFAHIDIILCRNVVIYF